MLSLPRTIAPAARRRRTTVASAVGTESARIFEPPVVRTPAVLNRSLSPRGTPRSGPCTRPATRSASAARAASSALSRSEEHTSELQSRLHLVCRLLLEKKKKKTNKKQTYHNQTLHPRTGTDS